MHAFQNLVFIKYENKTAIVFIRVPNDTTNMTHMVTKKLCNREKASGAKNLYVLSSISYL